MLATISSTEEDDCATLAAWVSMLAASCLTVRTISSIVAAVSVTLAACVNACCFTPSILVLIWSTALAVWLMLDARASPIVSILRLFFSTDRIDLPIFSIVSLKYSDISVISLLLYTGSRTVKSPSPWAMPRNAMTAAWMGFIMLRAITYTMTRHINKMVLPITPIERIKRLSVCINSSTGALMITAQPVLFIVAFAAM